MFTAPAVGQRWMGKTTNRRITILSIEPGPTVRNPYAKCRVDWPSGHMNIAFISINTVTANYKLLAGKP